MTRPEGRSDLVNMTTLPREKRSNMCPLTAISRDRTRQTNCPPRQERATLPNASNESAFARQFQRSPSKQQTQS